MKKTRFGIIPKLTLVFILFAAVLSGVVSFVVFENARAQLQAGTISELSATAIEKQSALEAWVVDHEADLVNMTHSSHLQDEVASLIAATNPTARKAARDHVVEDLGNWVGAGYGFRELLIIASEDGRVIAATDASDETKFKEDRPYFVNSKTGAYVQSPYYDLELQGPTMTIGVPITSSDGQLLAVLAGHLDLAEVNTIIRRRTGLRRTDDAFVVNTSNLFVTQPRLATDPSVLQRGIHTEAVNSCLEHNSGTVADADYRGIPALIVYRWLPEHQLCLMTKIDQAEAFAPEQALAGTIRIVGVIVLLLASVLAFGLAHTITRPMRALQAGVARFGQGDLDFRLHVGARDEIGQLAGAMNDMAASLRQSLGQTAHGQRMLVALSQAAQAVQRAQTPEQVYQTVGDEVTRLGYHAMAFSLVDNRTHLLLAHLTFNSAVIQAVEKVTGLSVEGFRFPIVPGGVHDQIITSGRTVFFEQAAIPLAESLPQPLHSLAGRITGLFGVEQAIYAPLAIGGKTEGLLMVTGVGLTEADAPAITAFANQTAIALENARMYQETRAWAEELEKRVEERTVAVRASEEKYRNLFENAQVGMFRSKLDGSAILDVNQNLLDIFGYTREEMIASPATMRWAHPEEREKMARRMRADGVVTNLEVAFITKTGEIRDFLISVKIYPEQGVLEGTGLDITDRKRADEALRKSKAYLENLIDHANAPIIVWDPQFRITRFNHAFEFLTGRIEKDVIGKSLDILFPPALVENSMALIRKTSQGERWETVEIKILHLDEAVRTVLWNSATLFAPDGQTPIATIAQGQDITERKRVEETLARHVDDLARSNKELEQFAYVASHDLQEPLRMVTSYVQLLQRRYQGKLDQDADEFIAFAVDGATRMQRLINDLLTFSRVGTRGKDLVAISSEAALAQALASLDLLIEDNQAHVTHDPLPPVLGDEEQLTQLFQNLVSNAVKFHGEVAPEVHIGAGRVVGPGKEATPMWQFFVHDNGIGIDAEYFDRIFIIFQRLHDRDSYVGTGIGLAICKKIVERHGGRIWVESQPGQGSTFYFTLRSVM